MSGTVWDRRPRRSEIQVALTAEGSGPTRSRFMRPDLASGYPLFPFVPEEVDGLGVAHVSTLVYTEGETHRFRCVACIVVKIEANVQGVSVLLAASSLGNEFVQVPGMETSAVLGVLLKEARETGERWRVHSRHNGGDGKFSADPAKRLESLQNDVVVTAGVNAHLVVNSGFVGFDGKHESVELGARFEAFRQRDAVGPDLDMEST